MTGFPVGHLLVLPILLPAISAAAIVLTCRGRGRLAAWVSVATCVAGLAMALAVLVATAHGAIPVYELGGWRPPYGIVLVADRMSALFLTLAWTLGLAASVAGMGHPEVRGVNYHALFLFELMGVSGAFLTGDLFNLFVCFEILLAASYGLMVQGGGHGRVVAALRYVVLNLVGSSVFLIALGLVYGTAGTLNMAQLGAVVAELGAGDRVLVESAAGMLIVVFGLKAAIVPLNAWLPGAYGVASPPVVALFAIMTKVGAYAILRVFGTGFGEVGVGAALLDATWLLGLATVAVGAIGALGVRDLQRLVAHLTVVSVGTLLVAVGRFDASSVAASMYYAVHSTLASAGLFLVVDLVARGRGEDGTRLVVGRPLAAPAVPGTLYLGLAVAVVGMPPLSGFVGKVAILEAALAGPGWALVLGVLLAGSLVSLVAVSRSGSLVFWRPEGTPRDRVSAEPVVAAAALLLALGVALAVAAEPVLVFTDAAADSLLDPTAMRRAVFGGSP